MKINTEDYLHKIDAYFKEKSQKDTNLTYIMVIAVIFSFAYFFFYNSSFEQFETTREQVSTLENKIQVDQIFLNTNPQTLIVQLDKEIKGIDAQTQQYKYNNTYIKTQIETISSLIYDERTWGEYLDSITTNAQRYHMKVLNLTNSPADTNQSFGHLLNIAVKSEGSFTNTLKFINSLEQSELVVDIHDLNITVAKKLNSDLKISVWGIMY